MQINCKIVSFLGGGLLLSARAAEFLHLKDKAWIGQKRSGCSCRWGTTQGQAKNRSLYGTKTRKYTQFVLGLRLNAHENE